MPLVPVWPGNGSKEARMGGFSGKGFRRSIALRRIRRPKPVGGVGKLAREPELATVTAHAALG